MLYCPEKVVIASNNRKKITEITAILEQLNIRAVSQAELNIICEPEETGTTFRENARIKALAVYALCGLPTIADDSGLEVDALDGQPGVYSARYGTPDLDDAGRNALLLENMAGAFDPARSARFVSAICLALGDDSFVESEGSVSGRILHTPAGAGGFGYDPLFYVESLGMTFAESSAEEKNKISHRAVALRLFAQQLALLPKK